MSNKDEKQKFIFFALAKAGEGISGSDRIFIELARNWSKKYLVELITSSEGVRLCRIQKLEGKFLKISSIKNESCEGTFLLNYLYKIFKGIWLGFYLKPTSYNLQPTTYIYSASDFWMDVIPALILKLRFNRLKWVATWYQSAPNPLRGFSEQSAKNKEQRKNSYPLSAFLYWFSQLPVKLLIKKFADIVIVNNENERKQFPEMDRLRKVVVLLGAVRLDEIIKFLTTNYQIPTTKKYDAVFQGRFHPQKGVVELIDIWEKVLEKRSDAKLAMIGDGPLMGDVEKRITMNKLTNNIELFSYVYDGPKKYSIFQASKLVVHPAFYDSGGMASAEAMAFGIPAVGFDLKAYESYYPKGMLKAKIGDLDDFAEKIIRLLNNDKKREKLGSEAKKMIYSNWSWEKRASEVLNKII